MPQFPGRAAVGLALATLVSLALAGCGGQTGSSGSGSTTPGSTASNGGSASAAPTPTPTPTDPPTPVTLSCDQLVTADQLYAYNPNLGPAQDYSPKDDSLQKTIADWKGVTCAWQNQTSGDIIQIAVAQPPASALEDLKNKAITVAEPVPTYGTPPIEGYFKAGDSGQAQVFRGPYWIVAESTAFFEPGDAAPLLENVLANIPAS